MKQLKFKCDNTTLTLSLKKYQVGSNNVIFMDIVENGIETTFAISTNSQLQKILNWLIEASFKVK